jgi:hypothetical protein
MDLFSFSFSEALKELCIHVHYRFTMDMHDALIELSAYLLHYIFFGPLVSFFERNKTLKLLPSIIVKVHTTP